MEHLIYLISGSLQLLLVHQFKSWSCSSYKEAREKLYIENPPVPGTCKGVLVNIHCATLLVLRSLLQSTNGSSPFTFRVFIVLGWYSLIVIFLSLRLTLYLLR